MHRAWLATPFALTAGLWLAACASDPSAIAPTAPTAPLDLSGTAVRLDIDVATGRISVQPPLDASRHPVDGAGPSFSLIGSDGVQLHAGNCTWSNVPANTKQQRCTFDLSLSNRLASVDLTTPTSFPKLPAGAEGILVFPWTVAALGVPGGAATPNTDWDNAPVNFFNDFSGCASGKTSDCYRSERYTSPLYGGASSETRRVGFDMDKNAQSVQAYIVVAADVRNNPGATLTVTADKYNTGTVGIGWSDDAAADPSSITARTGDADGNSEGFVNFILPALAGKQIVGASLELYQKETSANAYAAGNVVLADHVDFGDDVTGIDYNVASLPGGAALGTLSADPAMEYKRLEVLDAVLDDIAHARTRSQFRFRWKDFVAVGPAVSASYADAVGSTPPHLVLRYRNP
jgi:hypothetical protein